jgi:hypothetical protein
MLASGFSKILDSMRDGLICTHIGSLAFRARFIPEISGGIRRGGGGFLFKE